MTLLGLLFGSAFVACLLGRRHLYPYVLGISAVFPTSVAVHLGSSGVPPFYVGILLGTPLILTERSRFAASNRRILAVSERALVWLIPYALATTVVGLLCFRGLAVYSPRLGLSVTYTTPLSFSVSTLAQCAYLLMASAVFLYFGVARIDVTRVLSTTVWFGLLAALALKLGNVGVGQFPYTLIDNSRSSIYEITTRARGTFSEPSYLGAFAVVGLGFFVARMIRADGRPRWDAVAGTALAGTVIVLSNSGTAIVSVLVWGAILLVLLPSRIRKLAERRRALLVGTVVVLASPAVVYIPRLVKVIVDSLSSQRVSQSTSLRHSADVNAVHVFTHTLGLGAGLGSDRASSLATTLLATVGVVGTCLLAWLILANLRGSVRAGVSSISIAALMGLTAQILSVPDLTFPMLWLTLGCCANVCHQAATPNVEGYRNPRQHPRVISTG